MRLWKVPTTVAKALLFPAWCSIRAWMSGVAFRRGFVIGYVFELALFSGGGAVGATTPEAGADGVEVYLVNRKVLEFPAKEDLSSPEAAYATLNRLRASGEQAFWRRLSVPWKADGSSAQLGRREVSAEVSAGLMGALILEVRLWELTNAVVIAQTPKDIDLRFLCCVDGQWLNDGNDGATDLERAEAVIARVRGYMNVKTLRSSRPPVADPESYLRPFEEFLKREARDPQEFLLEALAEHRVVILGEVHNRQRYWAFNTALVRAPAFARSAGVIYLELPSNDQPMMDRFLAAPEYDPAPVIDVLRDMHEFGWPDQPTLEFCRAVWEANQSLPREQRLRIVLVDINRPWKDIQQRVDWAKYNVNRNEFMAKQIERDQRDHAQESRHALFIVGYLHAPKNLTLPEGVAFQSAGWHLSQGFGDTNVFTVFPHSPVTSDRHEVDGRLALGLFETAFARLSNRPIALPLGYGPFGEMLFDASIELITADPYRAGFDAFLYLGPLEDEIVSPLIPGFYTDEYAREIDRRARIMWGQGLEDNPDIGEVSGEAIRRLREGWWGQPRYEWRRLGPLDAWHHGSQWRTRVVAARQVDALKDAAEIRTAAERLFDALRRADYSRPQSWRAFPSPDVAYWAQADAPGWTRWSCRQFSTNPIVKVEFGEVPLEPAARPSVPYHVLLQDGTMLERVLPFTWRPESGRWEPLEGLDWHLEKKSEGYTHQDPQRSRF